MTSSIAAIHVAKHKLGLDDDTYRAKLAKITGKSSTKEMTEQERQTVLTVFRAEGFKPASKRVSGRAKLSGRYAGKLQALWIAAWNLGIVENRDDAALEAFIKRQTGLERERFLHKHEDAETVIEALKTWIAREAAVKWNAAPLLWLSNDRAKIAWAQWKLIRPGATLPCRYEFDVQVAEIIGDPTRMLSELTDQQWQAVMNAFGERVRARKVGA